MHHPLSRHVKSTAKNINARDMKTPRAKNSTNLFTLVIEEGRSLHHRLVKTPRFIGHSAAVWANFIPVCESMASIEAGLARVG